MNSTINIALGQAEPKITMQLAGAPNFRGLAGIRAADGRVIRDGRLFRSDVLSQLTQDDMSLLPSFDIRLVCDLRNSKERSQERNRWPEQQIVRTVVREQDAGMENIGRIPWDARLLEDNFDEEQARQYMLAAYRAMPNELAHHIASLVEYCSHPGSGAVLIHCMAGKDRTGFVCAMVLWALGVPISVIFDDYLESAERCAQNSKIHSSLLRLFGTEIPPRAQIAATVIGSVKIEFLQAAFLEIELNYGSIDLYLADVAGLNDKCIEQFRQQLLTP